MEKYTKKCVYRNKRTFILIPRQIMISLFCIYCMFLLAVRSPKEKKTARIEKNTKKNQQLI